MSRKTDTAMMKKLLQNRYLSYWAVLVIDLVLVSISSVISIMAVRYFGGSEAIGQMTAFMMFGVSLAINLGCFMLFRTYRHIIRHSSLKGTVTTLSYLDGTICAICDTEGDCRDCQDPKADPLPQSGRSHFRN